MLYEPVASRHTTSSETTNSEFYQCSAKRKCKFHFQFFCPLFSSFLIYMSFYFIISFHRRCICRQHSILCLLMHLFLKFPCLHLTYLRSFSASIFVFIFFALLFFFLISLCQQLRCARGSVLAFSTQVRGFKPGRSRRIFRAKKSSARLPSEGK